LTPPLAWLLQEEIFFINVLQGEQSASIYIFFFSKGHLVLFDNVLREVCWVGRPLDMPYLATLILYSIREPQFASKKASPFLEVATGVITHSRVVTAHWKITIVINIVFIM